MNSEQKQLFIKINNFSFNKENIDLSFSQRLARENDWDIEYTNRVIEEYRKFIFLAVVSGHIVTPSEAVDQVWHLHLTYTHSYWNEFCPNVLGKPLHHQPTEGGDSEQEKYDDLYSQTLKSYQKFFGNLPPQDIWSSPENRFGKDLSFKRINTEENWIIPKLNISFWVKNITKNLLSKFKRTTIVITSLFLIIFITLWGALPSLAQNTPFYWDFINVTLDIQDNGDLLVTEEQKYVFTDSHSEQHYRFIKLDKIKAIKDVQVFEDNHLLPIETIIQGDQFWIRWQDYLDDQNTHIFVLKYRVIGAITNTFGTDTLYWKAIFPKRNAFINHSEITVSLPKYLVGKIENYHSIGGNFKSSVINDKIIKFNSLQSLPPGQSTIIKTNFTGSFLHLNQLDVSPVVNQKISFNPQKNVIKYLVIFIGFFILFLLILGSALNFSFSENKSKNK
ncbi:MAG: DUF2207 domain-containing protein, partial [Waterburya sp.]